MFTTVLNVIIIWLGVQINLIVGSENDVTSQRNLMEFVKSRMPEYGAPTDIVNDTVWIASDIYQLVDVDEKNGILTAKLTTSILYKMESLQWDPEDYNGTWHLIFNNNMFWRPDISIMEALEVKYDSSKLSYIDNLGYVVDTASRLTMKLTCGFDVTKFPVDEQTCKVTYSKMMLWNKEFTIKPNYEAARLLFYTEHDTWELLRPVTLTEEMMISSEDLGHDYENMVMTIRIRRRSTFYMFVILMPNVLIYLLSTLVFLLPIESGDKVSYIVTVLLAEVVTVGTLNDIFPASSLGFPILAGFVSGVVGHLSMLCVGTALVVNVHSYNDDYKSKTVERIVLSNIVKRLHLIPKSQKQILRKKSLGINFDSHRKVAESSVGGDKVSHVFENDNYPASWKIFAVILDRIFFAIHTILLIFQLVRFYILLLF